MTLAWRRVSPTCLLTQAAELISRWRAIHGLDASVIVRRRVVIAHFHGADLRCDYFFFAAPFFTERLVA